MEPAAPSDMMTSDPVELSRKPHLRPDGQFVCFTLKQGDAEINLTPEQARSLIAALQSYAYPGDGD